MIGFLYGLTTVIAILSFLVLPLGLVTANGAPQEAAVAAICMAFVLIPYCLARALHEDERRGRERALEKAADAAKLIPILKAAPAGAAGDLL